MRDVRGRGVSSFAEKAKCTCVCMYGALCTCMHVCVHCAHVCVWCRVHVYACMCALCTCACMCALCTCVHVCVQCARVHTCVCVCCTVWVRGKKLTSKRVLCYIRDLGCLAIMDPVLRVFPLGVFWLRGWSWWLRSEETREACALRWSRKHGAC